MIRSCAPTSTAHAKSSSAANAGWARRTAVADGGSSPKQHSGRCLTRSATGGRACRGRSGALQRTPPVSVTTEVRWFSASSWRTGAPTSPSLHPRSSSAAPNDCEGVGARVVPRRVAIVVASVSALACDHGVARSRATICTTLLAMRGALCVALIVATPGARAVARSMGPSRAACGPPDRWKMASGCWLAAARAAILALLGRRDRRRCCRP